MDSRSSDQPEGTHGGPERRAPTAAGRRERQPEARGKRDRRAPGLVKVATIGLLLIALPFVVYFFTYTRHQRAYQTQHHVRHLATSASELTGYIAQIQHLVQIAEYDTEEPKYVERVQQEQEARARYDEAARLLDSQLKRRDALNDERVRTQQELASLSERTQQYLRDLEADRFLWSYGEEKEARRPFEETKKYLDQKAYWTEEEYKALSASTRVVDESLRKWTKAQEELENAQEEADDAKAKQKDANAKRENAKAKPEEGETQPSESPEEKHKRELTQEWKKRLADPYKDLQVESLPVADVLVPSCKAQELPGFRVDRLGARSGARLVILYSQCVRSKQSGLVAYPVRASIPIRDLLRESVRGGDFAAVFVARSDGRVLAQWTKLPSQISQLGEILDLPESSAAAFTAGDQTPPTLSERPSFEHFIGQPRPLIATIAGRRYRAYHEPVQLPLAPLPESPAAADGDGAAQGKVDQWILVGLVDDDAFRAATTTLPLNILGLALFAVILAVLSWPVLKLWLMSPREVLSRGDLAALAAAIALGVPLLTLFLLDMTSSYTERERIDASLEAVAGQLREGFSEELDKARNHLEEYADPANVKQPERLGAQTPYPPAFEDLFWLDEDGWQMPLHPLDHGEKCAYRLSQRGDASGRPLKLESRDYFSRIRDRSAYPWKNGEGYFFAGRILSRREGRKLTAISVSAREGASGLEGCPEPESEQNSKAAEAGGNGNQGGSSAVAVVLTRRMQAFHRTVLPTGYGFAVFEDDSKDVLYHSDDRHSLFENFLAEADHDGELLSAVQADRHLATRITYHGVTHRAFIEPIAELPWTLVVFADESLLQTVNFDLVASVLIFVLLYGGGIVFALFLVGAFRTGARWIMLWPQWRNERRYWLGILLILVLLLLAVATLWNPFSSSEGGGLSGWWRVAFSIAVGAYIFSAFRLVFSASCPSWEEIRSFFSIRRAGWRIDALATVVLFAFGIWFLWASLLPGLAVVALTIALLLVRPPGSAPRGPTRRFRFAYVSMWSLALMTGSVLPAAVFFEDAHRLQLDRLGREARLSVARNISDKAAAMREESLLFEREEPAALNSNDGGLFIGQKKDGTTEETVYEGPLGNNIVGEALFSAELGVKKADASDRKPESEGSEWEYKDEWTRLCLDHPSALFATLLPPYNRSAETTKQLYYENATDGSWGRPASGESEALVYCPRPNDEKSCFTVTGAKLPRDLLPEGRIPRFVAAFPVLVLVLGFWAFVGALADRVVGLGIWDAVPMRRRDGRMPWSALLVSRSHQELEELKGAFKRRCEVRTLDLSEFASQQEKHQQWLEERGAPAQTHPTAFFFEHLDDALRQPAARAALHERLRLLIDEAEGGMERWLGLISEADPQQLLEGLRRQDGANGMTEPEFEAWLGLLLRVKFTHRNCLLIRPPADEIASIRSLVGKIDGAQLDLSEYLDRVGALRDDLGGKRLLLIQNLEVALGHPDLRAELLERLEELTGPDAGGAPPSLILLCASASPLRLLAQADANPDLFGEGAPSGIEILRWSELLSRFHTKRFAVKVEDRYETGVHLRDILLCAKVSVLRLVGRADANTDPFWRWARPGARLLRWSELLAEFRDRRFAVDASARYQTSFDARDVLEQEKEWWPELAHAHAEMERELSERENEFSTETMVLRMADLGAAHYRHLWTLCTKDERLMLIQLARGRLLNPRNAQLVQQLLSRRLIRQMPDFQVATESFRQFVLQAESAETIARWEEEASRSPWGSLRRPLLIGLVVAAALLLWSGGAPLVAMVSGAAVAVPALLQLFTALRGGQAASGS